jgi:hypothetical protein
LLAPARSLGSPILIPHNDVPTIVSRLNASP